MLKTVHPSTMNQIKSRQMSIASVKSVLPKSNLDKSWVMVFKILIDPVGDSLIQFKVISSR